MRDEDTDRQRIKRRQRSGDRNQVFRLQSGLQLTELVIKIWRRDGLFHPGRRVKRIAKQNEPPGGRLAGLLINGQNAN